MLRAVTEPRQTKQTREELRAALLEAGREILLEEGLEPGSSNLTFKRAFDRVEKKTGLRLTNASVIRRVWENQADYQADVLVAIAQDEERPEAELTVRAIADVFVGIDLSTVESRAHALREVCRVGGEANGDAIPTRRVGRCGSMSWQWRPQPIFRTSGDGFR